jgi:thioredoxin 2
LRGPYSEPDNVHGPVHVACEIRCDVARLRLRPIAASGYLFGMAPGDTTIVPCPSCSTKNRVQTATASGVPRCSVCQTLLPWIVEATQQTFAEQIVASVPVLVDFWAPWCGPCRMVSPLVERLGAEHAGRLKVVKLNVDDAQAIAARYRVQGIPLLVVIRDGAEVDRLIGAAPLPRLQAWIKPHLDRSGDAGQGTESAATAT